MADPKNPASSATPDVKSGTAPDVKATKPLKPPNPMWKYMGFGENFRPKLPSRNWMIFLSLTGSITAAIIYDKREKNRAQRKWCRLVEHIAKEPIDPRSLPRTLTIFLEGPPNDGLRVAQDHFKEYVKPILVASGLDWEFVQGRKEGDIRAEVAERIRNARLPPDEADEDFITEYRRKAGIPSYDGIKGDIVIGRHTWKEYVRGLHEGWLGPVVEPTKPELEKPLEESQEKDAEPAIETLPGITIHSTTKEDEGSELPKADNSKDKAKKPPHPSPFISTSEYKTASSPPELPAELDPSGPIAFPHILGFLNTPIRLRRYFNRRALADQIGRETAAIILCTYRPYSATSGPYTSTGEFESDSPQTENQGEIPSQETEQQTALADEEKGWPKAVRVRVEGEPERTWLEPIVLDSRIASRMRRFELTPEDEARAAKIVVPEEEIEGWIKGGLRSLGRSGLKAVGYGKQEKAVGSGEEEILE